MTLSVHGKNLVQMIIDTDDSITPESKKSAVDYLSALREAGEKMATLLGEDITDEQLTEALAEWEAANK